MVPRVQKRMKEIVGVPESEEALRVKAPQLVAGRLSPRLSAGVIGVGLRKKNWERREKRGSRCER